MGVGAGERGEERLRKTDAEKRRQKRRRERDVGAGERERRRQTKKDRGEKVWEGEEKNNTLSS